MNSELDSFFLKEKIWKSEFNKLRELCLSCNLEETLKWKQPCYMHQKKNILLIGGFKDFISLSFFKGALLKNQEGFLEKPGENSQTVRFFKFTSLKQIIELENTIKAHIFEAIEIEKLGLKVNSVEVTSKDYPVELVEIFQLNPKFHNAFEALTSGRQRGYLLHFNAAKQSATKTIRIEKYIPRILNSKGINDCVCGQSKRMPNCDGSHKNFEKPYF